MAHKLKGQPLEKARLDRAHMLETLHMAYRHIVHSMNGEKGLPDPEAKELGYRLAVYFQVKSYGQPKQSARKTHR